MIPAQPGRYFFRYEGTKPDGKTYYFESEEVVAWNEDGEPLVLDERIDHRRQLRTGSRAPNYVGVVHAAEGGRTVQLIPGNGWMVEHKEEDGTRRGEPILAWALDVNGWVSPLTTDSDGAVNSLHHSRREYRVYHPDAYEIDAQGQRRGGESMDGRE
jgi:hypothetical protein